eukprot:scaffold119768_cov33-Tisochrysis_lutea.AAC.1
MAIDGQGAVVARQAPSCHPNLHRWITYQKRGSGLLELCVSEGGRRNALLGALYTPSRVFVASF